MNVNEIYNLNKNAVCLQCRNDKELLDVLKQLATVRSANQGISGIQTAVLLATMQRYGYCLIMEIVT